MGFYLDGFTKIKPTLESINSTTKCISDSLIQYRKEANISIEYVKYNPINGIPCKVGINDNIHDHFVAVSADQSHGLRQGEKIYLINVNESDFSIYTKIAFVQIVTDGPKGSADFYINKKMLKRLSIDQNRFSQGVFTIHYKQDK